MLATCIYIVVILIVLFALFLISLKSLRKRNSHGFYRFFVFEGTALIILINLPYWFENPLSLLQIISWCFLLISIILVWRSSSGLHNAGGGGKREGNDINFKFENTVNLVESGIYKYIRHPMYGSLLFLTLGALFKHITIYTVTLSALILIFLSSTAKAEEKENVGFFGDQYSRYMKKTKRFIPFIY